MRRHEDDLTAWQDDPVVRALTAPGSPDELAGEQEALAGFRATLTPGRSRRRLAGRFGTGLGTVVVVVGLSGGVAAAYGHALPAPIQQVAHNLLGPVGVPAPLPHQPTGTAAKHPAGANPIAAGTLAPAPAAPSSAPPPAPAGSTRPAPHRHPAGAASGARPPSPAAGAVDPSGSPTPADTASGAPAGGSSGSPEPSPTTTDRPAPPVASTVAMSVAQPKVPVGDTDTVFGQISSSNGTGVPDVNVRLLERLTGQQGWQQVGTATSDDNGAVTVGVPSLSHDVVLRLVVDRGVRSDQVRVVVVPSLTASVSPSGSTADVTVTANGAQAGDTVVLQRLVQHRWRQVGSGSLDGAGSTTFAVPRPQRGQVRVRAVLEATAAHGYAAVTCVVTAP